VATGEMDVWTYVCQPRASADVELVMLHLDQGTGPSVSRNDGPVGEARRARTTTRYWPLPKRLSRRDKSLDGSTGRAGICCGRDDATPEAGAADCEDACSPPVIWIEDSIGGCDGLE